MGIAAVFLTAPAAAAAAGLYFLDRHHKEESQSKVWGDGLHLSKMNSLVKLKKGSVDEKPKFAPEFDGLNCFETMVCH